MEKARVEQRAARLAELLAFVPDCVHRSDEHLATILAKPGKALDDAVFLSSPNPHYEPPAAAPVQGTD